MSNFFGDGETFFFSSSRFVQKGLFKQLSFTVCVLLLLTHTARERATQTHTHTLWQQFNCRHKWKISAIPFLGQHEWVGRVGGGGGGRGGDSICVKRIPPRAPPPCTCLTCFCRTAGHMAGRAQHGPVVGLFVCVGAALARLPVPLRHLLPISARREYKARELTGRWESFESRPGSWGLLSGCARSASRRACSYTPSTAARRRRLRRRVSAGRPQTRR